VGPLEALSIPATTMALATPGFAAPGLPTPTDQSQGDSASFADTVQDSDTITTTITLSLAGTPSRPGHRQPATIDWVGPDHHPRHSHRRAAESAGTAPGRPAAERLLFKLGNEAFWQ